MSVGKRTRSWRLTERIGRSPIRRKLMAIAMVTTAAALLLAGVGIVAVDSVLYRTYPRARPGHARPDHRR